jgi:hypothetical protein
MNSAGVTSVADILWRDGMVSGDPPDTFFGAAKPSGKIRLDFIKFIAGEKLGGLESAARLRSRWASK